MNTLWILVTLIMPATQPGQKMEMDIDLVPYKTKAACEEAKKITGTVNTNKGGQLQTCRMIKR